MAGKTNYLEGKVIDHVLRNTAYTAPATVYIGLYTAAPTDAGGGTEVTGNAYARQPIAFGAASGTPRATTNSGTITFSQATPSAWGTITHFGLFDASSAGNLLYWGALGSSVTIGASDTFQINASGITVTED